MSHRRGSNWSIQATDTATKTASVLFLLDHTLTFPACKRGLVPTRIFVLFFVCHIVFVLFSFFLSSSCKSYLISFFLPDSFPFSLSFCGFHSICLERERERERKPYNICTSLVRCLIIYIKFFFSIITKILLQE
jgi:hypothetical protein